MPNMEFEGIEVYVGDVEVDVGTQYVTPNININTEEFWESCDSEEKYDLLERAIDYCNDDDDLATAIFANTVGDLETAINDFFLAADRYYQGKTNGSSLEPFHLSESDDTSSAPPRPLPAHELLRALYQISTVTPEEYSALPEDVRGKLGQLVGREPTPSTHPELRLIIDNLVPSDGVPQTLIEEMKFLATN